MSLSRQLAAEFIGTLFLLAVVVGSGVMGETLAAGNTAVALLGNSLATGCGLLVLILIFGPVSGAHFNPAVSAVMCLRGELSPRALVAYVPVQIAGALAGVWLAHAMFDLPILQTSTHMRHGVGQWIGEFVATFGLMLTIFGTLSTRVAWVPMTVAAYITGAYWFTSSTSFANPAVTLARSVTNTFAGIALTDIGGFVIAQLLGAAAGAALAVWLWPRK